MDFQHFEAGPDDDGRRLDRVIRKFLPQENLSGIYKALRSGLIKVDGKKQKADFQIASGSKISIADFLINVKKTDSKNNAKMLDKELVVFRNEHLLFINKPCDMNVQKSEKSQTALNDLVKMDYDFNHPVKESLSFTPGPLHRLDRQTTGLICFSQDLAGARWFSKAIQTHETLKQYLAIVEGKLTEKQRWHDKIQKNNKNSTNFHTVSLNDLSEEGLEADTEALPLEYGIYERKIVTLVQFTIFTGRTHQIRSTSAGHGFPLLGDTAYGGMKINEPQKLFLHSWKLRLPENELGLPSQLICPPGKNFCNILKICSINFNPEL